MPAARGKVLTAGTGLAGAGTGLAGPGTVLPGGRGGPAGSEGAAAQRAVGERTVDGKARPAGAMRSAVYRGVLRHHRYGPGPAHQFSYPATLPLLDLDELPRVFALHPLLSERHLAPVRFRRSDFLGPADRPLAECVKDLVHERAGSRPTGPVALLAHLRTWGWLFNPISLYFCYDEEGEQVQALVAEVQNTPWHERCSYVVGPPGRYRFSKAMHVSPFLPMDVDYELRYTAPAQRLAVRMDVIRARERLFTATLSLERRPLDRRQLTSLAWSKPALAHTVSAGIYRQAALLRAKGAPFFVHPARRGRDA